MNAFVNAQFHLVGDAAFFGASEATIFSNRGSPRKEFPGRIEAKFAVAGTSWNFRDDFELLNREGGSPSGCMQRGFDSLHPL